MIQDPTFARLVALACHDLRTPLATVNGFARTLERLDKLEEPESRYLEMIIAAAGQMAELLEMLGVASQIAEGRYDPHLVEVGTLALAEAAAETLGPERVLVSGEGALVTVDERPTLQAVSDLALCALRHGSLEQVELRVEGPVIELAPVTSTAAPVLLGESLRDIGAAVAMTVLPAIGAEIGLDGETLRISLPVVS